MPSTATFPTTVPFTSVTRVPHFDTRIVTYGGKVRQRLSFAATAWYEIICNFQNTQGVYADAIMSFFEARKGAFEAFYFQNPEEAYRPTKWTPSTAYLTGAIIRPTVINDRSYKATTGGISHASSQPTWPTGVNGTVTDGTAPNQITWTENTYLVTFAEDTLNAEYFSYTLYTLGEVRLIQVSA